MKSYVLSPQPGSNASHQITTKYSAQNEQIRGVAEASRRVASKQFRFDPVRYGAKKLGGGAYGTAYLMRVTQTSLAAINEGLKFGGGVVIQQIPREGASVVVKVAKQGKRSDKEFYIENVRENVVHRKLSGDSCSFVPASSKPICVSKYVPKFYVSFIAGSPKRLESVTVMDVAGDMSLDKFVKGKKIPVDFFVDVERAICSLWLSGYIHGDLHRENIMIDTRTKRIQIIDFGFAIKMPPAFVSVLSRRISNLIASGHQGSLGDVWLQKPVDKDLRLINYSNRVMKGRGFPWYNPDYKVLQSLFNQVPRDLRKNIPAARASAWGIQLQQVQRQPLLKKQSVKRSFFKRPSFASSPVLRASAAKTYKSSGPVQNPVSPQKPRTVTPPQKLRTASPQKLRTASPQNPRTASPQNPRTVTPPQKLRTASPQKPRTVTPQKPRTAMPQKPRTVMPQKPRTVMPQKPRTVTPPQKPRTVTPPQKPRTVTPPQKPRMASPRPRSAFQGDARLRGLTNVERATVFGSKRSLPQVLDTLRMRKEECSRRGLSFNPVTKQCSSGQQKQVFTGCRENCARIGKRCGPRGKCIKL
ncbi:PBCV-specific basic adaptor domain-containing protein [Acanthocystis turfacea Chlorella virus WI0606]|nr:PBCV-specific basic adaptor domain-containing protein [Acanthocystis turfacea Chlorella virus WI0606]